MSLDAIFAALADPTRREVVELLGAAPQRASSLAEATGASRPGMSRHLRVLRQAGLVRDEAAPGDGRGRVYHLERGPLRDVETWASEVRAFWDDQLDAFVEAADDP